MPLTAKGTEILSALRKEYSEAKAKQVLYAGKNAGKFTGIDDDSAESKLDQAVCHMDALCDRFDALCERRDHASPKKPYSADMLRELMHAMKPDAGAGNTASSSAPATGTPPTTMMGVRG